MNEAIFKTAVMGGFNKSDVLEFLEKQDAQSKEREKDLNGRIGTLNSELRDEKQRGEQLTKRVEELESQIAGEREKYSTAVKRLQEAGTESQQEKSGLSEEIALRDGQIERLNGKAAELERAAAAAKTAATEAEARAAKLSEKLSLIDKTEDQIGRALLEAQQTSDKIMAGAKADADAVSAKAREEAEKLTLEAQENVEKINADAQARLDELLQLVEEYRARVTDARENAVTFFTAVDSVFDSMQKNSEDICGRFTSVFEKKEPEEAECTQDAEDNEAAQDEASSVNFDFRGNGI